MDLFYVGSGRAEPVPIELKAGRSGLGHESHMHRKRSAIISARTFANEKKQKIAEQNARHFRSRQQERFEQRRDDIDLYKSQKVCEQLDSNQVNIVACQGGGVSSKPPVRRAATRH